MYASSFVLSRISLAEIPDRIDIIPPVDGSIPAEVTPEQKEANAKRLLEEDAIRNKYVATFYTEEKAEALAKELGSDPRKTEDFIKYVVSTLRESFSATHNGWKAMIYNGEEFYESKRYDINPIIDRVGGGDSFSGGIIHGLLTKPNQGAALEFAVAASALKHTINGDFNLVSVDEVEALAGGDASGRVQR